MNSPNTSHFKLPRNCMLKLLAAVILTLIEDPTHLLRVWVSMLLGVTLATDIVKVEQTGGLDRYGPNRDTHTVAIFARNDYGEYFMWRRTGLAKPLVKLVSQEVARVVLKNLYRAPLIDSVEPCSLG